MNKSNPVLNKPHYAGLKGKPTGLSWCKNWEYFAFKELLKFGVLISPGSTPGKVGIDISCQDF